MPSAAVIGASNDRTRFGNKAVRAYRQRGYDVYTVNPAESEIEGLPGYRSILDLPVRPDIVSVYVRPSILLKLLPDIAAKGCDEVWLNPGTDSPEVHAEAKRLGLNVLQVCSLIKLGIPPSSL